MGKADDQVGKLFGGTLGRQRIVEDDLSGDVAALGQRRVVRALYPVVGPLGVLFLPLAERVLPQSVRVRGPAWRHGWVALGGLERIQFGLGGRLGLVQRVDVDVDGADNLGPFFAGGNLSARAVVVAAVPVVEDDGLGVSVVAEVGVEVDPGRAAAEILDGRINEPRADVVFGAGPSIRLGDVLHAGVAVLVLNGVLVDSLAHDALLLGMDDYASSPVGGGSLEHVAILVDGDPVERLVEPGDVAVLRTDPHGRIRSRVAKDGVDIDAAVSAAAGVANLDIAHRAAAGGAGRHHMCAAGDALDGDFRARSAVGRRIDGNGVGHLGRALRP